MTPSVTLVVVPRERFSYSRRSLESIYRHTDHPFTLIYVDGNSPPYIAQYLQRASVDLRFRLIRRERFLWPNEARNIGLKDVTSKYVVFLDNDIEVEAGWLTELVSCAEETGAWAVAPLYFEGDPGDKRIHMAGGRATILDRAFHEEHLFAGRHYDEAGAAIHKGETGFFEFHCVMLPLRVLKTLGPLDERYFSNHEHLDLSLLIRRAGGTIYLAPASHVTYKHGLLDKRDVEYAMFRWSDDSMRRSTRHFLEKWNIDEKSEWGEASNHWGELHRRYLMNKRRNPINIVKHHAARNVLTRRMYAMLRAAR
jgi:GT2 family glycosyltransferase